MTNQGTNKFIKDDDYGDFAILYESKVHKKIRH